MGTSGIYTDVGGTLRVVADFNTPVPGGPGSNFFSFENPSLDDGNVAFIGHDPTMGASGIYAEIDGIPMKIIDTSDALDGQDVIGLSIGQEGLSGDQIAFRASFLDGTEAIFVAEAFVVSTDPVDIDI